MVLQVPTVQLESNAPPMLRGGNVQQMQDVVTDDIKELGAAQKQIGELALKIQEERDDAITTQKTNEYTAKVNQAKLEFASLQGNAAIQRVGFDPETDEPITVLDQKKAELAKLLEDSEATLENDRQKYMFKTKASSTLNSANLYMTKHEIAEFQKYQDSEFLNEIDLVADTTGQNYEDYNDPTGEFAKQGSVAFLLANRYAEKKGWPENSSQRAALVQKVATKIHQSTLNQMIAVKDFFNAKAYLDKATATGTVTAAVFNTYSQKITTGYNKYTGEEKANAVLFNRGNSNSGQFIDKANKLFELDSFNQSDDGTGKTVKYGFRPDEIDTSQLNETNAKEVLEQVQNSSKFYNPESTVRLPAQHQTTHLFIARHFGVNKADSYFTKAKSELEIDTAKYKENAEYAKDINQKIIEKVIGFTNEEAVKKFGKNDNTFVDVIANDLQILKADIDYNYDPANGITYKTDEKTKMPLLADLKKKLKDTIQDEDQLTYALAELEKNYKSEKEDKEEQYDATLETAKEIAFAQNDGWTDLADNGIDIVDFTREDQTLLRNGHPEKSETNAINELEADPSLTLPENIGAYRGRLTQAKYLEYKEAGEKLQNGGSSAINAASVDADMFNNSLKDFGFNDILNKKNDRNEEDYFELKFEVKKGIDQLQIQKNGKATFTEKQAVINKILGEKVFLKTSANIFGFYSREEIPLLAVDEDQFDEIFVKVGGKNIFSSEINTKEREKIIQSYLDNGLTPPTEQQIANDWVRAGKPK